MKTTIKMFGMLVAASFVLLSLAQCKKDTEEPQNNPSAEDPSVKRMTATIGLAYNTSTQSDPICFIDFDSAQVYPVSQAQAHADVIDAVYVLRYSNANDPMFISLGSFDGQPGYPISSWDKTTLGINAFSNYNHTSIDNASSSLTTANFAGITKLSQLKGYVGTGPAAGFDFEYIDPTQIGNMYAFRTQQNKVGAFRLIDCQNGSTGYATIEIVMEK